jgi:multidrug efflux pump subunit AcrA (membrane-fusion protein)
MTAFTRPQVRQAGWIGAFVALQFLLAAGWTTAGWWWPEIAQRLGLAAAPPLAPTGEQDEHTDHVVISPEAHKSIGLVLGQIERRDFDRTITLPAIVAEQPGRSHIVVTTHFTGIITKLYVAQGQAVSVGQPLFDLRLTHEELIQSQTDLLKTAQEIEILDREIARIEPLAREGGIAAKTLLERKYERDRHQAAFVAQRQALLLHEMNEEQIATVLKTKQLLGSLTITALADEGMVEDPASVVLQVHQLNVTLGQHIDAGATLATLSDHARLLVEGEAFEQDGPALRQAIQQSWPLTLLPAAQSVQLVPAAETPAEREEQQLKLLYLSDTIDATSRTFHFYAGLDNRLVLDRTGPDARRYVQWQFRPGERLRVEVPVEKWTKRLVVPLSAIARDGVESYVFRYVKGEFQRTPVHVEHLGERYAVLGDGSGIREGQVIAMTAAQQVQFALAAQAGAGADPHAGHNH